MNKHAQALGRLGKGKPKKLSASERKRRAEQMKVNRDPKNWIIDNTK